jgi:predicted transcriptional regulator
MFDMRTLLNPSRLLKEARRRASISQRELARRAGTSQSVIARIESGASDPSTSTLNSLLHAAGFDLETELVIRPVTGSHMLEDVDRILSLPPEERLRELTNADQFIKAARSVG